MKTKVISMAGAAALVFSCTTAMAAETIRVTLQLPETHSIGKNWNAFKEIIEDRSDGDLSLQLFPSAQLFTDKEVPEAVGSGAVEAGSAVLGRFAGSVPAAEIVNLPFFFRDEAHLRAAVAKGSPMREILDNAILEETGARVLWWQAYGRNIYLNNGDPIKTPDDIKGKKVRTYGKVPGWTVEALGGAPTLMSASKQFLAYQQGAVDVGMTGTSGVISRKLYEVMENMTLSYDSAIELVAVINNNFFEGLSAENQKIILEAAAVVEKQLRNEVYSGEDALVASVEDKINVVRLSDEERAKWVEATASVQDRFVEAAGPVGAQAVEAAKKM
ncbi:2,3-diketo-L-gulonate-binding periplasmic protein YiaO precursor [Pseudovibrio axinellae]|uniref:2,3-diketo-L-gulonate-binding periplasmic protein YiaO n=1 Tax=Pseudovibrio axinellae TaxID=989403 RepID=A0A161V888_9HYPH|nr:TRAP transporter substrate-binding protein DctP [Pseudovibrio axinellae]KZL15388.1 2,3-diketo-L-gulonate-binding periplasmic protein YiaO precursor [Pseudovibrio axinellae]SER54318.1 C4-dicarboxylate-binding protein DctP [Pseudovibrio axinellae]